MSGFHLSSAGSCRHTSFCLTAFSHPPDAATRPRTISAGLF